MARGYRDNLHKRSKPLDQSRPLLQVFVLVILMERLSIDVVDLKVETVETFLCLCLALVEEVTF